MAVTREQFDAGMTYDAYKAQMTRNQEQFEQNEKDLQLSTEESGGVQRPSPAAERPGAGRGLVRRRRGQPAHPGPPRERGRRQAERARALARSAARREGHGRAPQQGPVQVHPDTDLPGWQ